MGWNGSGGGGNAHKESETAVSLIGQPQQAHAQTFHVECRIDALGVSTKGQGGSRKAAEQQAAAAALAILEKM